MRTLLPVLAGAALVVSTAACSSSAGHPGHPAAASGAVQQVTVHTTDLLRFQPSTITVHTGTVRITLIDDGAYPHDMSLPTQHVTSHTVTGTPGEQRTTVTLHLDHPGTYPFLCTYHASAGMRGELIVTRG